jgi:hypothetical protein
MSCMHEGGQIGWEIFTTSICMNWKVLNNYSQFKYLLLTWNKQLVFI